MAYDTIWSLALGLDNALKQIVEKNDTGCEGLTGRIVSLEKFTYTNRKMGCILHQSLSEVHFTGITVSLLFYSIIIYYDVHVKKVAIIPYIEQNYCILAIF